MIEAPKEIWCSTGLYYEYKTDWSEGEWSVRPDLSHIKYVRADRIENLTVELQLAVAALGKVQAFVKDLDLYADQGTMLHPALYEACMVYERLKK